MIFYGIIPCVPARYLLLQSDVGRFFLVLAPLPQARPGGQPYIVQRSASAPTMRTSIAVVFFPIEDCKSSNYSY